VIAAAVGVAAAGAVAVGAVAVIGGAVLVASRSSSGGGGGGGGGVIVTPYDDGGGSSGGGVVPQTGDVQITLEWDTTADLDLHVIDPYGEEIYHGHSRAESGGELDVDANHPCGTAVSNPLENVFWPWGGAPGGEYQVYVDYYGECSNEGAVAYQVIVRVDGDVIGTYPGRLTPGEQTFVTSFQR
jgi:hypothetical protein